MNRIHTLLFIMTSIVVGCQTTVVEFTDRTPEVSTGDANEIGRSSVVLSGSFIPRSSIDRYDAVYCFCVYNHDGYLQNYYFDSFDYNDVVTKTIEINGLQPNTTYYYKFGAVHGELNEDGSVTRYSPSEVWGEEKSFVTEASPVKSMNIIDYGYYHKYYSSGLVESYVEYKIELIFNASMLEEIQNSDYKEYGFYAVAEDWSFAEFTPDWWTMTTNKIVFTPKIDKEKFKVSHTSGLYHAQTAACKIGFYVMDQNSDIIRITEEYHPGFEYSLQPKIELLSVEQGELIQNENHVADGYIPYEYVKIIEGALFFDSFTEYRLDDIWTNRTYNDCDENMSTSSYVYPSTEAKTEYLFWSAEVDGVTILPDSSIKFVYDGRGNVDISLSSDVPEPY